MPTPKYLKDVLEEYSARKYYVEWSELGFTNHVAHSIVALELLGAGEAGIRENAAWVVKDKGLKGPEFENYQGFGVSPAPSVDELVGKRANYYAILDYYEKELDRLGSVEKLAVEHFPKLASGLAAHLIHGIIQIGYGIAADYPPTVLEGFAYLHHSHVQADLTTEELQAPLNGKENGLEILNEIRENKDFLEGVKNAENNFAQTKAPLRNPRAKYLLTTQAKTLLGYCNRINLGVTEKNGLLKIANQLVHLATVLYVADTHRNDFFILHAVTGAWSLKKILEVIAQSNMSKDAQEKLGVVCARSLIMAFLYVFVYYGAPEMKPEFLEKTPKYSWDELVPKTIGDLTRDEHIFKLVQVVKDMAIECPEHDKLFLLAGELAIDNDLFFVFGN